MNAKANSIHFVLGTAQLGMTYGIANQTGKPSRHQAFSIIKEALKNQIYEFDTAQAYGEAEEVLGYCFEKLSVTERVKVISKINPQLEKKSLEEIIVSVQASLRHLKIGKLYGLLLHTANALNNWEAKYSKLFADLKKKAFIELAGVSIYEQDEFEKALEISGIDIIQIPMNVFDQRAIQNDWIKKAIEKNKKIYIRSIYLQGLLLIDPAQLPSHMKFARPFLEKFSDFCSKNKLTKTEASIKFVLQSCKNSKVIMGIECFEQLSNNLKLANALTSRNGLRFDDLSVADSRIINPSKWN